MKVIELGWTRTRFSASITHVRAGVPDRGLPDPWGSEMHFRGWEFVCYCWMYYFSK